MWMMNANEGTAAGISVPVLADCSIVAVLTNLWDDETGVRVSVDWNTDDALSAREARALAAALLEAASVVAPY